MSDSLQVRECAEEVRPPGRGPIAATELKEFWSEPIAEAQSKGGLAAEGLSCVTVKVYTPGVG
jgi:hypothetical protein